MNSVTHQETSRKFRIRFHTDNQEQPTAVAHACARHLSSYITLHDVDTQGQDDDITDRRPSCTVSLQHLADAVLNPQRTKWPSSKNDDRLIYLYWKFLNCIMGVDYADVGTAPELVPDLVRSCLLDPSFPALVEAVENSMKKLMTSSEPPK